MKNQLNKLKDTFPSAYENNNKNKCLGPLTKEQETFWTHLFIFSALTKWISPVVKNIDGCAIFSINKTPYSIEKNTKAQIVFFQMKGKTPVFSDPVDVFSEILMARNAPSKSIEHLFAPLAMYMLNFASFLEKNFDINTPKTLSKDLPEFFAACAFEPNQKNIDANKFNCSFLVPTVLCEQFLDFHKINFLSSGNPIYDLLFELNKNQAFANSKNLKAIFEEKILNESILEQNAPNRSKKIHL